MLALSVVVAGSLLAPVFIPRAAAAVTAYVGTEAIHPSFITGGVAIVIASLVILLFGLRILRRPGDAYTAEEERELLQSEMANYYPSLAEDPALSLSPEMQYALSAAFEKLKKSREGLDQEIAERTKDIEKALQDAKEIVEAVPEPLYMFAFQMPDRFSLMSANQAAIDLHEEDMKKLSGRTLEQLWPDINARELRKALVSVMNSGQNLERDFQKYTDSKIKKSYLVRAFNISDSRLGMIVSDNTTRKREEVSVVRERDKTRSYLDSVDSILLALDRDGTITMINKAGCNAIGKDVDKLTGQNWFEYCIPEESRGEALLSFNRVIAGEAEPPDCFRQAIQSGDGESRDIEWHASCLIDALGQITGVLYRGKDITLRSGAKHQQQENEQRLCNVVDSALTGILIVDPDTNEIVDINPVAAELIGSKRDVIIGTACSDYILSENEQPPEEDPAQTNRRVVRHRVRNAAGEEIPVIAAIAPVELNNKTYRIESFIDISNFSIVETELMQSKEEYHQLVENANEGIFIAQDGKIPFCNPKMREITGYGAEELASMPFSELIYAEDRDFVVNNHYRRLNGEEIKTVYAFRTVHKTGQIRWVEIRAVVIEWMGKPGTLNFITDITDRKEAEEKLRKSEASYRLLTENLNDVVIKVSMTGILQYVSPAVKEFGGYSPEEEIGQHIGKYFAKKKELTQALRLIKEVMLGRDKASFEFLYQPKEGEPFFVEVTGKSHVVDGKIVSIVCVLRDISFRKEAEQALKDSEMRFRSVIESVPNIAVQGFNGSKEIIFWNKASEMLYGYSAEEALGKKLDELIVPNYQQLDEAVELDLGPGENAMRHKDGSLIPVYSSHVTLSNIYGEEEMYCLDVDLTALKRAREQQRILKEKLEYAERMESLGILAGGVAHDLNNMLGPMVGYSDLLLTKMSHDSPYRKQVRRIGKAAQDAADVIQDLLTLARRGRYEMAPISLNDVVSDYLESPSFQQLAERRDDIELHVQLDKNAPHILGSAPHLAKTVMNLIVNSYDAMGNGGTFVIKTEVRTLTELLSGHKHISQDTYLLLRVKDTGGGISDEDLEKIFEPYYSKKKMGASGSGLGLAVVYGIVKDHKGYYDIFSTPGDGTEFVLYFPVTRQPVEKPEDKQADLRGRETILVIDDNAEQRQITSDLLSNLGYAVITADGGHEAVGFLRGNAVDLVLIDMIMENGYDGLDTYKDILAIHPGQKAIIISGFSATERVATMQEMGAGAYVRKPFTLEKLGRAVREELDRQPAESTVS